jgi:DNA-binding NtrC family response regulator
MDKRGRILVIDDDAQLCTTVRRALQTQHDVETFTSGKAAIERLRTNTNVDVILCDLIMPELTGPEIYDEISRLSPDLCSRMIFSTGGAFTENARNFLLRISNKTLEKPFDVPHLRAMVKEAVAEPHS